MRTAFIETLCELAERDERIWLLTGDLGYSVLERFAARFPNRYVNVGVAEQNMTGIAAGLALSGNIVFTYSIANFPVMRCLEQIRNDVCFHNLNVKIIAVGGGLTYGPQGHTHHGIEDFGVLRPLPNMTILAPGDPIETRLATKAIVEWPGPCYMRLGKAGEPIVHQSSPEFIIGRAVVAREGNAATLISTGGMLKTASEAVASLAAQSIHVRLLSMHTLKPLDVSALLSAARETQAIVTVEEHTSIGGLGDAVAAVLQSQDTPTTLERLSLSDRFNPVIGSQDYLRQINGLSSEDIVASILNVLKDRQP